MTRITRRNAVLGPLALAACTPMPTGPVTGTTILIDSGPYTPVVVTDTSRTPLPGEVRFDRLFPFTVGSYVPADPATGAPESGGRIAGNLQARVVLSASAQTLSFSYRFRDLVFTPSGSNGQGGSFNFIEIVTLGGFAPRFFPMQAFDIAPSQSLGAEVWGGIGRIGTTGNIEFNSYFTRPGGTTFFSLLTGAVRFATSGSITIGQTAMDAGANPVLSTVTLQGVPVPA